MSASFLSQPAVSAQVQALFDADVAEDGYVSNVSRLWAHQPAALVRLFKLMESVFEESGLSFRQRAILVTAAASTLGDSYCSLAWGGKLAAEAEPALAAGVLSGLDDGQIFAVTAFTALRIAFATVNDSLGAVPDVELALALPDEVRAAVTFGRPIAG